MTGKTHMLAGIAVSTLILAPGGYEDISAAAEHVTGIAAAAIGSVICDIDVHTSGSYRKLVQIVSAMAAIILALLALDWGVKTHFWQQIKESVAGHESLWLPLGAGIAFLLICIWGSRRPHRSFMHSFLAVVLLGGCVYLAVPVLFPGFVIGMLSHILLDVVNYKKIRIFFPYIKGFALRLCQSGKTVDSLLFAVSIAVIAIYLWSICGLNA